MQDKINDFLKDIKRNDLIAKYRKMFNEASCTRVSQTQSELTIDNPDNVDEPILLAYVNYSSQVNTYYQNPDRNRAYFTAVLNHESVWRPILQELEYNWREIIWVCEHFLNRNTPVIQNMTEEIMDLYPNAKSIDDMEISINMTGSVPGTWISANQNITYECDNGYYTIKGSWYDDLDRETIRDILRLNRRPRLGNKTLTRPKHYKATQASYEGQRPILMACNSPPTPPRDTMLHFAPHLPTENACRRAVERIKQ